MFERAVYEEGPEEAEEVEVEAILNRLVWALTGCVVQEVGSLCAWAMDGGEDEEPIGEIRDGGSRGCGEVLMSLRIGLD